MPDDVVVQRSPGTMSSARTGERLSTFWFCRGWKARWQAEVARRAKGLKIEFDDHYFFHTNPLYEPSNAMKFTGGRYGALFDEMARTRPRRVLEIGCAHGLAAWLMRDFADEVVGVDIQPNRIAIGRHLFPEVELVAANYVDYLAKFDGRRFDLIVQSWGPVLLPDRVFEYGERYAWLGYRPLSWRDSLTGRHKLPGRQLSHSATVMGEGLSGRGPRYWRYYFTRDYLMIAVHALRHGYKLPL